MSLARTSHPRRYGLLSIAILCALLAGPWIAYADDMENFIGEMVDQHGFDRGELTQLLNQSELREDIIKLISKPAEGKPWFEYRKIFVTRSRINGGVDYWQRHAKLLKKAEDEYGVDAAVIVAIIGVETRYGKHTGSHRVLDALRTLAFDYPPRSKFFRKELGEYLLLTREEQVDPLSLRGSYAGAMGHGQFMPSSYRHYAVDFDGDGKRDLWHNPADVIGSVANYLAAHGWRRGEPVATPARVRGSGYKRYLDQGLKPSATVAQLRKSGIVPVADKADDLVATLMALKQEDGEDFWLGFYNFYVITRYNHSFRYAMAVYQLADEIAVTREINEDE